MMTTESSFWTEVKKEFNKETDLSNFKNWNVVRNIPVYKEDEFPEFYSTEVNALINHLSYTDRDKWYSVLKEPFTGHTTDSYNRTARMMNGVECSSWTLKSAHHILTFEQLSGKSIHDYEQIVEFGAGIGETGRIIKDLKFKGDYYIYDLPEISRISNYYLDGWAKIVSHYNEIPWDKETLFIGTWSISEVPPEYRDKIANYFRNKDFLITFQNTCFGYDNFKYFTEKFPYMSNKFYRLSKHFGNSGWDSGSYYLIAV